MLLCLISYSEAHYISFPDPDYLLHKTAFLFQVACVCFWEEESISVCVYSESSLWTKVAPLHFQLHNAIVVTTNDHMTYLSKQKVRFWASLGQGADPPG